MGTALELRLAAAVTAAYGERARVTTVTRLSGGRSGETHRLTIEADEERHDLVVKVAPAGLPPVRNRNVLRQARLLHALERVPGIEVPPVAFEDAGDPPDVPPLFAMGYVAGVSYEPVSDPDVVLPGPTTVASRALGAAAMLARLHAADPAAVAPDEPFRSPADEITRWADAFATVDEELSAGYEDCAHLLRATLPAPGRASILHGDWRLGNMLCRGGDVTAVIDWELWSVGDPRLDVAWFLAVTAAEGNPIAVRTVPGMPTTAELLTAYEAASGSSVENLDWFTALIRFKGAATMALNVKNNRKREQPNPEIEGRASRVPILLAQAMALLGAG